MRFSRTQLGGAAVWRIRLIASSTEPVSLFMAGDYDDVRRTGDEAGHPVSVAVHVHQFPL